MVINGGNDTLVTVYVYEFAKSASFVPNYAHKVVYGRSSIGTQYGPEIRADRACNMRA